MSRPRARSSARSATSRRPDRRRAVRSQVPHRRRLRPYHRLRQQRRAHDVSGLGGGGQRSRHRSSTHRVRRRDHDHYEVDIRSGADLERPFGSHSTGSATPHRSTRPRARARRRHPAVGKIEETTIITCIEYVEFAQVQDVLAVDRELHDLLVHPHGVLMPLTDVDRAAITPQSTCSRRRVVKLFDAHADLSGAPRTPSLPRPRPGEPRRPPGSPRPAQPDHRRGGSPRLHAADHRSDPCRGGRPGAEAPFGRATVEEALPGRAAPRA